MLWQVTLLTGVSRHNGRTSKYTDLGFKPLHAWRNQLNTCWNLSEMRLHAINNMVRLSLLNVSWEPWNYIFVKNDYGRQSSIASMLMILDGKHLLKGGFASLSTFFMTGTFPPQSGTWLHPVVFLNQKFTQIFIPYKTTYRQQFLTIIHS